jgi:hypothetical protein
MDETLQKCIACEGRYFKKETILNPQESSDGEEFE